ncbi:MAG: hypothetical protein KAW47_07410 [Thermoplasmatales archaeon]|nr:hypothetical protein [Thermoplasmatales archaeon]
MTELNFVCKNCRKNFDCNVGKSTFPIESERPHFEKNIICPTCGNLSIDDVELTELGQTQLSSVFIQTSNNKSMNDDNHVRYERTY